MADRTATYRTLKHAEKLLAADLAETIVQCVIDKLYDGNICLKGTFINRFVVIKNAKVKYVYACCIENNGEDVVFLMTRKDAKSLPELDGVSFVSILDKFDDENPKTV